MAGEVDAHIARLRVPDLSRVVAGGSNPPAVGAERHGVDFIAVLGEGQDFLAFVPPERGRVPDANGPVRTRRGEAVPVWAERNTRASVGVSAQTEYLAGGG